MKAEEFYKKNYRDEWEGCKTFTDGFLFKFAEEYAASMLEEADVIHCLEVSNEELSSQNKQLIEALEETDSFLNNLFHGGEFRNDDVQNRIGNNHILLNQLKEK